MRSNLIIIITVLISAVFSCSEDTVPYSGVGSITGRVVEADNFKPIGNAKVVLTPTNNTVFTDSLGYFEYEQVEVGDYSVSSTKEGFLTAFKPVTVSLNLEVNTVFEMEIETSGNRPPSAPKLLSPEDNATNVDLAVELVWSASDPDLDTIHYTIRIRNDRNDEIEMVEDLLDSTYVLSNLTNNTKYFWEVSASDQINEPVWSPAQSFRTKEATENRFLYVKEVNGNNVIFSSDDQGNDYAITNSNINSWRPRKNLATNLVAFLRTENFETQLYTMNPDGSNVFKVTSVSVDGFKQSELDFSWSSNGSKLIYPHFDKLYEINKDGSGLRLVHQTPDGSFISECDWSSDGNLIALKTNNSNGYNVRIYTIDPNGAIVDNILSGVNGAAGGLDLSIDNKLLLYTYDVSEFESASYRQLDSRLFIYNFTTGVSKDVSVDKENGTIDIDPRFSPSEAEIIFVNTPNDGISGKSIYTQSVEQDSDEVGNGYNRKVKFENAIMPDWE
ncbi:carboxypeptidase regulatory-like domain-containing protein [Lutimonas saemankumensis]|uniref:carboxypeptidase regulatory-like domain-containing protein n=1 Tax=Lutimonas saemankumensis TaxID=483016 RepID=UPI001CD2B0A0|nr:carboxypeptidase regulatory-like domain-containing protein [Lutimonas saemankumensis]MCA0931256.1 carboxypeptidase regulatory-like domain-containing protein [Lutimonas saemankumensis]